MRTRILFFALALTACGGPNPKDTDPTTATGTGTGAATGTGTGTATGSTYVDPDAPVANDDVSNVAEGAVVPVDILANDIDPNDLIDSTTITIVDEPAFGTLDVAPQGIRYRHDGSEDPTDTFTYTVNDITGLTSNVATVTVTISPVNDPPTAVDDIGNVIEDGFTNINLSGNDTDPDDAIDPATIAITAQPAAGTVVVNANGTVDYTHNGLDGATDIFAYTIQDVSGAVSNPAQVTVNVTNVNDPPTAVDDDDYCPPGGMNTIDLADNDIDPDDGLNLASIFINQLPAFGTVVVNADGTVDYTHDGSATYYDSFEYTIQDNAAAVSNVATVNLTITDYVPPVLVGNYLVSDGPSWNTNPPVYTCMEACAMLFGGAAVDYQCSTSGATIDRMAYSSSWGVAGCPIIAEDYSLDQGGGYDCGAAGCSSSAYVQDNCQNFYVSTNYCWNVPFP